MWQLRITKPLLPPAPLEVSLWQAPRPIETPRPPEHPASTEIKAPSPTPKQASKVDGSKVTKHRPSSALKKATTSASTLTSKPPVESSATTIVQSPPTDAAKPSVSMHHQSLADRVSGYVQAQQQRELSAAELAAIVQKSKVPQSRSAAQQHQAELNAQGMASNVVDVFDDGRQLIKVGQSCYIASPSTDLLKDPLSIKGARCGDAESTADQINTILEQRRNRHATDP